MIILGIDPGTTRIGYGIISFNQGKSACLEYGTISQSGNDQGQKILSACLGIEALIEKNKPDLARIAKLFFF